MSNEVKHNSLSFEQLTDIYVRFLKLTALLPLDARSYEFVLTRLLALKFLLLLGLDCSMFIVYTFNHLKQGDKSVDLFCEAVPTIGMYVRYVIMLVKRNELRQVLTDSRKIWGCCDDNEKEIVKEFEKKIRIMLKFLFGSVSFTIGLYLVKVLTTRLPPLEPGGPERRLLLLKFYVDEVNTSPGYELLLALQTIMLCDSAFVVSIVDMFIPLLILLGCGYLRVIQNRLFYIFTLNDKDSTVNDEIIDCCNFHQQILNICLKVRDLTPTLYMVQILGTAYVLSLFGLKISTSRKADAEIFQSLSTMMVLTTQLYICQWAPDQLIQESEAVSTAAYFASLSRISNPRSRKILLIMNQRAQKPVILTAAGVLKLSIETFRSMMTSAISFFTALRSVSMSVER